MKVFFKVGLALVAVAGVTYWLLSKCAQPAQKLRDYRRSRRQDADELLEADEDEA